MKRLTMVSKAPARAQSTISLEVKLAYMVDFIDITLPLIQDKDQDNPA